MELAKVQQYGSGYVQNVEPYGTDQTGCFCQFLFQFFPVKRNGTECVSPRFVRSRVQALLIMFYMHELTLPDKSLLAHQVLKPPNEAYE